MPQAYRGVKPRPAAWDRIARVRALAPPLWAGAVLALSCWPAARGALPVLGVLQGPLGLALAALALAVSIGRAWRPRLRSLPPAGALFAVAAAAYLALGLFYASRLRVSGDEPHYLLMAQSLWREGDLDLRDNLARGDWSEYTPGPVSPHWGAPRRDGRPFPAHSPGMPLVLAPVYALGGRLACVALLALAAAAVTVQVRALALRVSQDERTALLAWAASAGPPAAFYAFHVYTEVPSTLALVVALNLLLEGASPTAPVRRGVLAAMGAALLACALPWLHVKMAGAAAAIGLLALVWLRGRARLAFVAVAAGGAAAYLAFFGAVYGLVSPIALYGGAVPGVGERRPLLALAGLALDRSFGLLPHAPVFVLAVAGLAALAARARESRAALGVLALALATLAPVFAWRMWWGGQCPPGRFLVPVVPALAVAASLVAPGAGRGAGLWRWRWTAVAMGLALAAFMAADPGRLLMLNRGDRPTRVWAALSGGADLNRYLPSLVSPDAADLRVMAVWLLALAAVFTLHTLARTRRRFEAAFRSFALPLGLMLAAGAAVDLWARPADNDARPVSRPGV